MMPAEELVSLDEFCASHNIEISFIRTLQNYGLIETTFVQETAFVSLQQLPVLERIIRLHYDLDINLEGIETINHLLQRADALRTEITSLRNRLRLYENG